MNIFEKNKLNIDKRISIGFEMLSKNYQLKEIDTKEFKHFKIQNMDYSIKQYQIKEVGNLLIMVSKDSQILQMDSLVITPYYKNLPLFSTDYMYIKEKRSILNEIYSLTDMKDELYNKYINEFIKIKDLYDYLIDMPVRAGWYDDIRTLSIAKNTSAEDDEEIIRLFVKSLEVFIKMEQESPLLNEKECKSKWQKTQDYADNLVSEGGVSTDIFKSVLGIDKTKRLLNKVFFATELYKS